MKRLCIVALLFSLQQVYCQLPKKEGDIIVEMTEHAITPDAGAATERISTIFYFSKKGLLLEKVSYAKASATVPDYVEAYTYDKTGKPKQMVKLVSDGRKLQPVYETRYVYDKNGRLTDASVFNAGKKSVFMKVANEYDSIGNLYKTINGQDIYLEKEYTKDNRIEAIRQIMKDTLKWECNFTYKDAMRTGTFSTRYGAGTDFTKDEIVTKGKTANRYTSNSSTDDKIKYYYDETGLLEKTEYYTYLAATGYVLQSYITIKVTGNVNVELVNALNEQIVE